MREKIEATAKMLNITTEYLFMLAHRECSGVIWGLSDPKVVHYRWYKGFITEPPYVRTWLERNVHTVH